MEEKFLQLIEEYKTFIKEEGNENEVYKWNAIIHFQENWDFQASDFYGMFKESFSKKENLMYQSSYGFLDKLGKAFPDKLKKLFSVLLNRNSSFSGIYRNVREMADYYLEDLKRHLQRDNLTHQLDERAISFIAMLGNPEKFYLYKSNVYKAVCEYLEFEPVNSIGEKYNHFEKIGDHATNLIENDNELLELCKDFIPNNTGFNSSKLIFQDILYNLLIVKISSTGYDKLLSRLIEDIKEEFDTTNHPLYQHTWLDSNSKSYRLISIIPDIEEMPIYYIHYELYSYGKELCFEVHPEGDLEFKKEIQPFIEDFGKKNNSYKLTKWFNHVSRGDETSNTHKKIVPIIKVKSSLDIKEYNRIKSQLIEQFKTLYYDFNKPFLEYHTMNEANINVKSEFINWLTNRPKSKYFNNDKEELSSYLDDYNTYFEVDLFEVSKSNYKSIIDIIDKVAYQDENSDFFIFSEGEIGHRPRTILGRANYYQFLEEKFNKIELLKFNNNSNKTPINKILYGPPGTGKTFYLKDQLFDKYTSKETSISQEQNFETVVGSCSWWQVIGIALLDMGTSKVSDIFEHKWVKKKANLSNSKTIRPTLWGQLQSHTVNECAHVNVSSRQQPLIFNKTEDSYWEILEDQVEELVPELYDLKDAVENYNPDPDKIINNYDFVTFHQSFAYEDFIEGIKPISPEEGEESKELGYRIENGVFKELCIKAKNDPDNKYAIFIDEINRGNVSAIFGELITLIEVDKRQGAKNEMSIKLPYSKTEFSVPSNIDIYGTMNTADRSVEALDTALRRRFEFKEMMPDENVIKQESVGGLMLSSVLRKINERIELLIDRDHTIGHSYFVGVDTEQKLANAFNNKIVPLLQEYFYGDYGKIGLILGNGFVFRKDNKSAGFADFKYENANDFITNTFILNKVDSNTVLDAVRQLIGIKDAE